MRSCTHLAAEIKNRKARRLESNPSINLTDITIDNFIDRDDEEGSDGDSGLAVNFTELNLACNQDDTRNQEWFIDSGASRHVTGLKNLLGELEEGCRSKISTA